MPLRFLAKRHFPCKYFKMRITSFREKLDVFSIVDTSMSWFRYIDIPSDDVIKVGVTMIDQISKIAKFGN